MQPSEWVLLVDPVGRPGEYNMATDDALLDEVTRSGRSYLRLYRWHPPALSVGRNQQSRFDGIPVVRRPTGGQAVWHEREVTYAVAAPIAMFGSLRNAYCEIHKRLAVALRSLGVDAVLAGRQAVRPPPSGRPPSCFAVAVGGEILVAGKKLVGSAQVRRGDAFLQHGSILLAGAQKYVDGGSGATTLAAVLGRVPTFQEITTAIVVNWGEPLQRTGGGRREAILPPAVASAGTQ
jgi:lipoate-protein ligase A